MTTSVRLDPDTEALLERLARSRRTTKSAVLRDALSALSERPTPSGTIMDVMRHGIGCVRGGGEAWSERTGRRVEALLRSRRVSRSR